MGSTITDNAIETELQVVLEWLNGPDQSIRHNEVQEIRGACTGMWFLKRKDYSIWCEETSSLFWIHGIRESAYSLHIPGYGD